MSSKIRMTPSDQWICPVSKILNEVNSDGWLGQVWSMAWDFAPWKDGVWREITELKLRALGLASRNKKPIIHVWVRNREVVLPVLGHSLYAWLPLRAIILTLDINLIKPGVWISQKFSDSAYGLVAQTSTFRLPQEQALSTMTRRQLPDAWSLLPDLTQVAGQDLSSQR